MISDNTLSKCDANICNGTTVNIAVVGVAGPDNVKGKQGVGKSCLCNRFVRPNADHYLENHLSVISQQDFCSPIINKSHFLYWGCAQKEIIVHGSPHNVIFQVVEQTEFIDDKTFSPLKSSSNETYFTRCAATLLQTNRKIAYLCKEQIGAENEFDQITMPGDSFKIDGFLLVIDVSVVSNRPIDQQIQFCNSVYQKLCKTKKPIVVTFTKYDHANTHNVQVAKSFVHSKKLISTLVESSSKQAVNVDEPFLALAALIVDKIKGKFKVPSYIEAEKARELVVRDVSASYLTLLLGKVHQHTVTWPMFYKEHINDSKFVNFVYYLGLIAARREFMQHLSQIREDMVKHKLATFFKQLPAMLDTLYPSLQSLESKRWEDVAEEILSNDKFDTYFMSGTDCLENERLDNKPRTRVPIDVLRSSEAEKCFILHVKKLEGSEFTQRIFAELRSAITSCHVQVGQTWFDIEPTLPNDLRQHFSEAECLRVFAEVQQRLLLEAELSFYELMVERPDVFAPLVRQLKTFHGAMAEPQHLRYILDKFADDVRCQTLDPLPTEREVMLCRHLSFLCRPEVSTCFYGENCKQLLLKTIIKQNFKSSAHNLSESPSGSGGSFTSLLSPQKPFQRVPSHLSQAPSVPCLTPAPTNMTGPDQLRVAFVGRDRQSCDELSSQTASLNGAGCLVQQPLGTRMDRCLVSGDVGCGGNRVQLTVQSFSSSAANHQMATAVVAFRPNFLICPYGSGASLSYLWSFFQEWSLSLSPTVRLPVALLYLPDHSTPHPTTAFTHDQITAQLCSIDKLLNHCSHYLHIDTTLSFDTNSRDGIAFSTLQHSLRLAFNHALNSLVPKKVSSFSNQLQISVPSCDYDLQSDDAFYDYTSVVNIPRPDMNVIMCLLCGDPISIELVLGPLLANSNCSPSNEKDNCILYDSVIDMGKKTIKIKIVAFHELESMKNEIIHGFIFVYSACRLASFANLSYLCQFHPWLVSQNGRGRCPTLVLAVREGPPSTPECLVRQLLEDGASLAKSQLPPWTHRTVTANFSTQTGVFYPFLTEVWRARGETERVTRLDMSRRAALGTQPQPMAACVPVVPAISSPHSESLSPTAVSAPRAPHESPRKGTSNGWLESDNAGSISRESPAARSGHGQSYPDEDRYPEEEDEGEYAWPEAVLAVNTQSQTHSYRSHSPARHSFTHSNASTASISASKKAKDKRLSGSHMSKKPASEDSYAKSTAASGNSRDGLGEWPDAVYARIHKQIPSSSPSSPVAVGSSANRRSLLVSQHGKSKSELVQSKTGASSHSASPGTNGSQDLPFTPAVPAMTNERLIYELDSSDSGGARRKQSSSGGSLSQDGRVESAITGNSDNIVQSRSSSLGQSNSGSVDCNVMLNATINELSLDEEDDQAHIYDEVTSDDISTSSVFLKEPSASASNPTLLDSSEKHGGARKKTKLKKEKSFSKKFLHKSGSVEASPSTPKLNSHKSGSGSQYFGAPLDRIVIRESNEQGESILPPVFVTQCVEYIEANGLTSEGIYRQPGNQSDRQALLARFESHPNLSMAGSGASIPVDSVASALKHFFTLLPHPLVPTQMQETLTTALNNNDHEGLKGTLQQMPVPNNATFKFLLRHLQKVAAADTQNKMTAENLATCFWPTLLRPAYTSLDAMSESYKCKNLIEALILNYDFYFVS